MGSALSRSWLSMDNNDREKEEQEEDKEGTEILTIFHKNMINSCGRNNFTMPGRKMLN